MPKGAFPFQGNNSNLITWIHSKEWAIDQGGLIKWTRLLIRTRIFLPNTVSLSSVCDLNWSTRVLLHSSWLFPNRAGHRRCLLSWEYHPMDTSMTALTPVCYITHFSFNSFVCALTVFFIPQFKNWMWLRNCSSMISRSLFYWMKEYTSCTAHTVALPQ